MKLKNLLLVILVFISLTIIPKVYAHCPLCSAATGAAVATTRFYGLNDCIVGLFIGGFIISTALWFNNFLLKKNKNKNYLPLQSVILVLFSLSATISTFYFADLLNSSSKIFGVNNLIFGTITGTIITPIGFLLSNLIKKVKGKVLLPFQGIILPLILLIITGLVFYFWVI